MKQLSKECIEAIKNLFNGNPVLLSRSSNIRGAKEALTNPSIYEKAGLIKKEGANPSFANWIVNRLAERGWKGFNGIDEIKEVVDMAATEQSGLISLEDALGFAEWCELNDIYRMTTGKWMYPSDSYDDTCTTTQLFTIYQEQKNK